MNKSVQKYVILLFSILIPLTAAFFVGLYGYKSDKYGQGAWLEEFQSDYLSFKDTTFTTADKIAKYTQYGINSQYYEYNASPVISETVKNNSGEDLFQFDVYRAVYKTKNKEGQDIDRLQYLFFIYNVQYLKIKNLFDGDQSLKSQIENANVPSLSINLYQDISKGNPTKVIMTESEFIPDYDADVDFISGKTASENETLGENDKLVYVVSGFSPIELSWVGMADIEVVATFDEITDDEGNKLSQPIMVRETEELTVSLNDVSDTNWKPAFRQNLSNQGYFGWVFAHKLWWICLITFVLIGVITGSFYLVYKAELEQTAISNSRKGKKSRR
jgi:hypothetical protein